MTDDQRRMLRAALNSQDIQSILNKLSVRVNEADVEASLRYPNVLQLKSRSHQLEERERALGQAVCLREHDHVLLLGNTPSIEGFFLQSKHPIQLKGVGEDKPDPPPGVFVQAFLKAWQHSKGWTGIWLYVDAPRITTEFARQRWDTAGTQPRLEPQHFEQSDLPYKCALL